MGVCAGAGYTVNAPINDPRIKAGATTSASGCSTMTMGSVAKLGHLKEQRPLLVGGVAITISGRGGVPIWVRRPIRMRVTVGVGITVIGSRGYCGPE